MMCRAVMFLLEKPRKNEAMRRLTLLSTAKDSARRHEGRGEERHEEEDCSQQRVRSRVANTTLQGGVPTTLGEDNNTMSEAGSSQGGTTPTSEGCHTEGTTSTTLEGQAELQPASSEMDKN